METGLIYEDQAILIYSKSKEQFTIKDKQSGSEAHVCVENIDMITKSLKYIYKNYKIKGESK